MKVARISSVDKGFVPRRPGDVYALLSDVGGYGAWWPGTAVTASDGGHGLTLDGAGTAHVSTEGHRQGVGLYLRLEGPSLEGSLEWYLEPFKDGTIVHAIVDAEPRGRWPVRRVERLRAAIRRGLVALREGR